MPLFKNVDGVRFLTHQGGCGGTREDARNLCSLIAGHLHNPNVAGATVLSLGCQNAEVAMLHEEIRRRNPKFSKPLAVIDQQACGTQSALLSQAVQHTFRGLVEANSISREPAPLSGLTVGLKCGGSDGFSGFSANPAVGHVSDLVASFSSNSTLATRMPDLIDFDTGEIIAGRCTVHESEDAILRQVIEVASGRVKTKAEMLGQYDFIPWKRGISL